jgi:hypothetical protein
VLQGQAAQVTFQPQHGYSVPPSMASRPFSCVAREGVAALLSWLLTALWQALVAVVLFVLQYPQVRDPTAAAAAAAVAGRGCSLATLVSAMLLRKRSYACSLAAVRLALIPSFFADCILALLLSRRRLQFMRCSHMCVAPLQVSVPTLLILSAGWYIRSRRRDTAAVDVIFECAQQVMRQPEVPTAGLLVGVLQAEVTRLLASSTAITRRDVARLWPRVEEALRADRALKFFVQEEAGSGANWPAVKLLSPLKVGALHMHPHARYPGQQHFGGGGGSGAGAGAGGAAGAGGLGHIFSPARQPQPAMQPQQQAAHNAGAGYAAYPYAGGLAGYAYGGGGGAAAQPAAAPDADGAGGYPTVPPAYAPIPSGVRTAGAGRAAGAFLSPAAFPDDDAGAGAGAQGKRLSYGGAVSTAFVQPPARMDSGRPGDYA